MNPITIILVYALGLFVLMYLFVFIPGKKKNKQVRIMHDAVKAGDEIVTIGGIIGTVKERNDDEIVLVVNEDGTTLHLLIYAVQSIRTER